MLWYDLETFGLDPDHDRIAQFACVRTDEQLEEIDDPVKIYCKPPLDYLPAPAACAVHGITPQMADELGLNEYAFARRILSLMAVPGTTVAGYNTIHFDDEFIRRLLYRNLLDPYEREWANGNSRWDVINLLRAARDLRPEGIVWPNNGEGTPLFKLESLSKANGIRHESAHDALSDIRATIAVAALVRQKQPKLYEWYFSHRQRESLKPLVDLSSRKMLAHTAAEYTRKEGCTTLIAPVAMDPMNRNQLIAIDLRFDPEELLGLDVAEIRARVFTKASELSAPRVPLTKIRLNQCPFLAPSSTLSGEAASRLGLDREACERRLAVVSANPGLVQKLTAVFDETPPPPQTDDPELLLYHGSFFPPQDKARLGKFHILMGKEDKDIDALTVEAAKEAKKAFQRMKFLDDRIPKLAGRLFARNFPETLNDSERLKWRGICAQRLQLPSREGSTELADYGRLADLLGNDGHMPAPQRAIVHSLLDWKAHLEREVLSHGE